MQFSKGTDELEGTRLLVSGEFTPVTGEDHESEEPETRFHGISDQCGSCEREIIQTTTIACWILVQM